MYVSFYVVVLAELCRMFEVSHGKKIYIILFIYTSVCL